MILKKKNISDIVSNLRTKKQKTDLKACNYELNKFGKDNENAIKLNDADLPQMLENYQLDNERGIAYMLVFTKKTMNNMQFYRMRLLQREPM